MTLRYSSLSYETGVHSTRTISLLKVIFDLIELQFHPKTAANSVKKSSNGVCITSAAKCFCNTIEHDQTGKSFPDPGQGVGNREAVPLSAFLVATNCLSRVYGRKNQGAATSEPFQP